MTGARREDFVKGSSGCDRRGNEVAGAELIDQPRGTDDCPEIPFGIRLSLSAGRDRNKSAHIVSKRRCCKTG